MLSLYIPSVCTKNDPELVLKQKQFNLDNTVKNFLSRRNQNTEVLLLLGRAGVGKTTFS